MADTASKRSRRSLRGNMLIGSKWTALVPFDREKHFVVVGQRRSAEDPGAEKELALQALTSKRIRWVRRDALRDAERWRRGWH